MLPLRRLPLRAGSYFDQGDITYAGWRTGRCDCPGELDFIIPLEIPKSYPLWGRPRYSSDGQSLLGIRLKGSIISKIYPQSPAAEEGLFVGDELIAVAGKTINDLGDLRRMLGSPTFQAVTSKSITGVAIRS